MSIKIKIEATLHTAWVESFDIPIMEMSPDLVFEDIIASGNLLSIADIDEFKIEEKN